jgi:hypothetical protein
MLVVPLRTIVGPSWHILDPMLRGLRVGTCVGEGCFSRMIAYDPCRRVSFGSRTAQRCFPDLLRVGEAAEENTSGPQVTGPTRNRQIGSSAYSVASGGTRV